MWTDKKFKTPTALLRLLNRESAPDPSPHYGKRTKASRQRVITLLGAIKNTNALLAASVDAESARNYWTDPPKEIGKSLEHIGEILAEYPLYPTVEIGDKHGDGGLHFDHATGGSRWPVGEQLAVWDITTLAELKRLDLVRECPCGQWFFARRKDQTACGPTCRHKKYEQTEAFKAQRRAYMRSYYALKKTGKVR